MENLKPVTHYDRTKVSLAVTFIRNFGGITSDEVHQALNDIDTFLMHLSDIAVKNRETTKSASTKKSAKRRKTEPATYARDPWTLALDDEIEMLNTTGASDYVIAGTVGRSERSIHARLGVIKKRNNGLYNGI